MTSVTKLIMASTRKLTLASQNNSSDSLRVQVLISNLITRLEKVDSDSEDECTSHWWMQARKRALDPTPSFNEQKSSGLKIRLVFNKQKIEDKDNDSSSDSESDNEFENENEEDMDLQNSRKQEPLRTLDQDLCLDSDSDSDSDSEMEVDEDEKIKEDEDDDYEEEDDERVQKKSFFSSPQDEASSDSDIDIGVEESTFETPQIEADYNIHCEQKSEEIEKEDDKNYRVTFEEPITPEMESISCCSPNLDILSENCCVTPKMHMAESSPCSDSIIYSNLEDLSAWRNPGSLDPMMSPLDPKTTTPTKDLSLSFEIQVLQDRDDELECPTSPSLGNEKRRREEVSADSFSPTKRSKSCCISQDRISPLVLPTLSSVFTDA